jgi:hypothetical protein
MNVVERTAEENPAARRPQLPPPLHLEVGSIVTIRMRGHSRTNGQEYYAPCVVLNQYGNQTGDIEVLVWDPTAGTHYNPSYPTRELGTRGDGNEREIYEIQSNVRDVLFSPDQFRSMLNDVEMHEIRLRKVESILKQLEPATHIAAASPMSHGAAAPSHTSLGASVSHGATASAPPLPPKGGK